MFWSSGKKSAKPAEPAEPRSISIDAQEVQQHDQHFLPNVKDSFVSDSAPSLSEFLRECDNRYGQHASEYSQFLEKLQNEAIRVQHFKKLTNQELLH